MKRILVTGGSGFLGKAVVQAIAARGDWAIAFDSAPARLESDRVVFRLGDITDLANLCQVFKADRPDAVVHCAAIVGVMASLGSPGNVFRVNVDGAINLFEAMRLYDVRRVVHISSEEVYGEFQADVVTEAHPTNPLYAYGITKLAVEHLGRTYAVSHGLECINVRTCWVYGPAFPRRRVPQTIVEAALQGRALHIESGGDSRIDHTYVDDVVDGILRALDHTGHLFDTYHVASGEAPSLAEMVDCVKALVPGADLSIGDGVYKHAGEVAIPRKGALDCTRAREVFGYQPRYDLKAGLAAYVANFEGKSDE